LGQPASKLQSEGRGSATRSGDTAYDDEAMPDLGLYVETAMSDRQVTYARVHFVAWVVWAATWVVAIIRAGGQPQIVAESPAEYVGLGILFASCFTLVMSATAGRLHAGTLQATYGPIAAAAAMLGLMLPSAIRTARRSTTRPPTNDVGENR
jgi:hypothetical protein